MSLSQKFRKSTYDLLSDITYCQKRLGINLKSKDDD